MAILLLRENATVTICHSKTRDLSEVTSRADILIAAIGRPGYLTGDHVKSGATVVDVGINRVTDSDRLADYFDGDELENRQQILNNRGSTLVGDANAKQVMAKAGNFTPVPGGVGLLTVAVLMRNTVDAKTQTENNVIMNFREYQAEARKTAMYPDRMSNLAYPTLGLAGEAGEVANIVKKIQRDFQGVVTDEIRGKFKDELGDVLWYISAYADQLGLTLSEIAAFNVGKLAKRHAR